MTKKTKFKLNSRAQYYLFQFTGWWLFTVFLGFSMTYKKEKPLSFILFLIIIFVLNLGISHFYRYLILRTSWMKNALGKVLFKLFFSSLLLGVVFSVLTNVFNYVINKGAVISVNSLLNGFILGFLVYFIWSILYFVYLFFYRARRVEFKNLQIQALQNEVELRNLRSQMNPHFMFNSMNSIRALIDEDPAKSKKAITQLSNILRNSLINTKSNEISLKEELSVVDDYLSLEKIRYEERLEVIKNIDENCLELKIPPLLLQTLVENGIKHGVSKFIKGGIIKIRIFRENNWLVINIINTGSIQKENVSKTGIGIENTKKRLRLKYKGKASFYLREGENNTVITEVIIPIEN